MFGAMDKAGPAQGHSLRRIGALCNQRVVQQLNWVQLPVRGLGACRWISAAGRLRTRKDVCLVDAAGCREAPIGRRLAVPSSCMSLLASCISSSGLGCGHWSEFIYACKRAWPEVLAGLVLAGFIGVTSRRHPQALHLAVGVGIAVIVGFIAYYISL
jgi:hypothetical protein